MNPLRPITQGLLTLSLALGLLSGCKDEDPCDEGEEAIGTGCYPRQTGGSGGTGVTPQGGAPMGEGGAGTSTGNPDATFGTACESDADCGGDAPICDYEQFHYCLQTECQEGEQNEGVCPDGWTCFKYLDNPSACIKI
ncbi:MAG: hypothetical protein K0R38_725 [Polyangiaceae bacterium]|jgi:hypothetical protein|nr:hypothetical protein [Polyangiaceae bacterium]